MEEGEELTRHPSYIQWRRDLQEHHLLFLPERGHSCWEKGAKGATIDPILHLYGCLDCAYTHWCVPPYRYCPRVVSVDTSYSTCAFSGTVLSNSPIMMLGTYKQEGVAREIRREVPFYDEKIHFSGRKRQKALRKRANRTSHGGMRNKWHRQADTLESMDLALMESDIYARAFGGTDGDDSDGDDERPTKRARIEDQDTGDDDTPGVDTDGLMYRAGFNAVASPLAAKEEVDRDVAYMLRYVQPVADLAQTYSNVFLVPPRPSLPPENNDEVPPSPPPALDWPLLQLDVEELLPHQQTLCRLITAFLDYFIPLATGPAVPPPLTPQQYTIWADRVILIFNHFADPRERYDVDNASTLQRLLLTLLTALFTVSIFMQDSVGISHYIWLPDAWLQHCDRAGLFTAEHLQKMFVVMKNSGRHKTSQWANKLMAVLKHTTMSVHALQGIFAIPPAPP